MNAPERPVERRRGPEWMKAYRDALAVEMEAPGIVCLSERHYREGRHTEPYRSGYVHRYRLPDEHWHRSYEELLDCEDRSYD